MTPPNDQPRFRIGAVARMTGISTHALRMWERRYGSLQPARNGGGLRTYTPQDVERLRLVKALVDQGHPVGSLMGLSSDVLRKLRHDVEPVRPAGDARQALEAMLDAAGRMDVADLASQLTRSSMMFSTLTFLEEVLSPLLVETGQRWADGRFSVAHEHAVAVTVRTHLAAHLRLPTGGTAGFVATTLEGEGHELGAMMAALLVTAAGHKVAYLGAELPIADVMAAQQRFGAHSILLSMVQPIPKRLTLLKRLRSRLPAKVRLQVGGAGAPRQRLEGVEVFDSLSGLWARLTAEP